MNIEGVTPLKTSSSRSQRRVALAALAIAGFSLVLLPISRYGAGLTPDSVQYIAGARSLAAGKGFVYYDGSSITRWPPLYSALLSMSQVVLNIDPLQIAGLLNAFLFSVVLLLSYTLATTLLDNDRRSIVLAILLILLSVPLQEVSLMAWSEPLFIVLTLIFLISLQTFLRSGSKAGLLLAMTTAAAASLTRYIGLSLVVSGAASIFLFWKRPPLKRLALAFLFGVMTGLPLAAWLARNWNISGTLLGPRSPAVTSLLQVLDHTVGLLLAWLAPWLAVMILLVISSVVVGFDRKKYVQKLADSARQLGPSILFTLAYIILLIYSQTRTELNVVDNRYMSPVYIPLILLALSLFSNAIDLSLKRLSDEANNLIIFATSVILLAFPLVLTVMSAVTALRVGTGGYSTELWANSEIIRLLRNRSDLQEERLFTNGPDASYILLDIETEWIPARNSSNDPQTQVDTYRGTWPPSPGYIVWYDNIHRDYLLTIEELEDVALLQPLATVSDGAIYHVSPIRP